MSSASPDRLYADRRVVPSILSADFSRLGEQVAEVMDAGARLIHVDVMDGHFVPPITMGPLAVSALAEQVRAAGGAVEAHLMVARPEDHVEEFARAGASSIWIHAEATAHANRTLSAIREAGCLAGLALNPGTPVEVAEELDGYCDVLLCMTVNPGWGGQAFIPGSPGKVARLRRISPDPAIEVDGGIEEETVAGVANAGATLFVAGSAVFGDPEPAEAYRRIVAAAGAE